MNASAQEEQSFSEPSGSCMGAICALSRYEYIEGAAWLWCSLEGKPVIQLPACPRQEWARDERGWPVSVQPREDTTDDEPEAT